MALKLPVLVSYTGGDRKLKGAALEGLGLGRSEVLASFCLLAVAQSCLQEKSPRTHLSPQTEWTHYCSTLHPTQSYTR